MGFRLLLMDVQEDDLTLAPREVQRVLEQGAAAVVITHMWGWLGDAVRINALCRQAGVPLVEDASRAYGACADGVLAGTVGDLSFLSMNRSKVLGVGEGGFLVCDDPDIWANAASLGLPLHVSSRIAKPATGFELGRGEKHTIHPAAAAEAIELLPTLKRRISVCVNNHDTLETRMKLMRGSRWLRSGGTRGAWKDASFFGRAQESQLPQFVVRKEFDTNELTTWVPTAARDGQKFLGARRCRELSVVISGCPYDGME